MSTVFVKLELLPSGTVAQHLGFQNIGMNIWMTLWHAGTLLVIWQAGMITDPWHRHTNDETQLSQSGRLC